MYARPAFIYKRLRHQSIHFNSRNRISIMLQIEAHAISYKVVKTRMEDHKPVAR